MGVIKGNEFPLLKIFSSDFEYHIPAYQRPYAWTKEETGTLFDDLYSFYQTESDDENYFLGSIVLIKESTKRRSDVIDGQQRLTTLTILFAVLASKLSSDLRSSCMKRLQEEGDKLAGIASQPRLFLREWDQDFFYKYIQNVEIDELLKIDTETLDTESKKHIKENCEVISEKFEDSFTDEDEIIKFSSFLLNRCYIVVVSTPSQESAFRVFSVMNSRGLDLLPTDIIKSETIGKLPKELQSVYTAKWEKLENDAGRDGFNEIFTHTRTIFALEKAKKNLLDEFHEHVVSKTEPKELIDDYIEPYTEAYLKLKNCAYSSTENAKDINDCLGWLNRIGNYDWMPSAILFMSQHSNDSEYLLWFIKKLERLSSYLQITGQDVNKRMARYKYVLMELQDNPSSTITNPITKIELTEWEKSQFINTLAGDIYTMPSVRRNYIIQRLDSFVSDGGATYNTSLFTIEHVLPQTPSDESEWRKKWPDDNVRLKWLNKLANLVPLTRQRNSAAQNYDFDIKKDKYFKTKSGTTSYQLTTQVVSYDEWTPEIVEERQRDLLGVLSDKWELNRNDEDDKRPIFLISGRGALASGYPLDEDSFKVLKDSKISLDTTDGFHAGYLELRKKLIDMEIIKDNIFVNDYVFDSPSVAAAVVVGRSANGRKEWATLDGRALGKYV